MKPHIVIDARLYGPKHTGIGRYTKNLLIHLAKIKSFNKYNFTIIIYPEQFTEAKRDLNEKFNLFTTRIRHYSLQEQLIFPFVLKSLKPDIVHFTNFNKPIFYFPKSVVTIHDLIKHFSKGSETTTRGPLLYWLKYYAYKFLTDYTITHNFIIVPSNFWRDYILNNYHLSPNEITTTYEAIDPKFLNLKLPIVANPKPYILYTGNLYPHKNISVVFNALVKLPNLNLKIICPRSLFENRVKKEINKLNISPQIEFLGYVKDVEFKHIYSHATCLVHPSFMEGFSLTGLEAMALNCPVISSNSSCLPEIYQNSVMYFDPNSSEELITCLNKLIDNKKLRLSMIRQGHNHLKKYSWAETAIKTFKIYQNIL